MFQVVEGHTPRPKSPTGGPPGAAASPRPARNRRGRHGSRSGADRGRAGARKHPRPSAGNGPPLHSRDRRTTRRLPQRRSAPKRYGAMGQTTECNAAWLRGAEQGSYPTSGGRAAGGPATAHGEHPPRAVARAHETIPPPLGPYSLARMPRLSPHPHAPPRPPPESTPRGRTAHPDRASRVRRRSLTRRHGRHSYPSSRPRAGPR